MLLITLWASVLVCLSESAANTAENTQWEILNKTVNGNLHRAVPFSLPCFSIYEGEPSTSESSVCAEIQSKYGSSSFRAESYNGFMYNQDEICAVDSKDQCLLNDGNPFDSSAFTNISCNQGSVSPYYIEVHSIEHIITALDFSHNNGIQLSIKNSGHDFLGRSSSKGSLALWLRKFGTISRNQYFVPEGCDGIKARDTITTGAGITFDEVYKFADTQGVTFVGGYAATVGASGGWVQGGGHSVLSVVYGLGIDRVQQFKIVTPDGVLRTANQCTNSDLFWALRGGGGGTFGIVVTATHAVEPAMQLSVASITYPQTPSNVNGWLEILVNNSLQWAESGWGGHYRANNLICVTPILNLSEAKSSMEIAASFATSHNGTAVVETLPSWYAFYTKYVIPSTAPVGAPRILASRLIPSYIFREEKGRVQLLALLKSITNLGLSPYIPNTTPFLYPWSPDSTSATTAWRDSIWELSVGSVMAWNGTIADRKKVVQTLDGLLEQMEALVPGGGTYLNEAYPWTRNWKWEWWGENYYRLLEIKKKYDPDGVLRCWKCVGFEDDTASERFPCFEALALS